MKQAKKNVGNGRQPPVSLAPLSLDEAVSGLLRVKPDPKPTAKKTRAKKKPGK